MEAPSKWLQLCPLHQSFFFAFVAFISLLADEMQIMFLCLTCDRSFMSERMSLKRLYSFWCCGFHSFLIRKNICHNLWNPPCSALIFIKMTVWKGNMAHLISIRCEIKLNCYTMICTLYIHSSGLTLTGK